MTLQAPKSWITSPLGINILISLCGGKGPFVDKYTRLHSDLKGSKFVNIKNKILISPSDATKGIPSNIDEIQKINFEKDELKNVISSWVNQYGNFKHDIVKYLTPECTCLFLNICTLKTKWRSVIDGKGPVMKIYNSFKYTDDTKYETRFVELPLQDDDFKLIVVVPNETDSLSSLINTLTNEGLENAIASIQPLFTVKSELTAQQINFECDLVTTINFKRKFFSYRHTAIQYGGVDMNETGFAAKVFTCMLPRSAEDKGSFPPEEQESSSFFFAVTVKGTPIFTGKFTRP